MLKIVKGLLRYKATWRTWDEPDRQVAVAQWVERDVAIVFPLEWATRFGQRQMIARAKARIMEVEGKSGGRHLEAGSVLLAFSAHEPQPTLQQLVPDMPRRLF
jgi:hypothetical protein